MTSAARKHIDVYGKDQALVVLKGQESTLFFKTVKNLIASETQLDQKNCCHICGNRMAVNENGVSTHLDSSGLVDYNADADHTAYVLS